MTSMTSNDPIVSEEAMTSGSTHDIPERDASQQGLYPPADTSLKGPTSVEPEVTKHKARPRRRVLCYVCGCFWLTVVVFVVALLIFALAVFKQPQVAFQSLQPETSGAELLSALLSSSSAEVRVYLVATVTNPNAFALDLYGINVDAFADAPRQQRLANGTLSTLELTPGTQNVTIPLFLQLPASATTLLRTCATQSSFPLYYSANIGLTWIRWLTTYKYPITGNLSLPCPFDLNGLLKNPAAVPEITSLISNLPTLLQKYLPQEKIAALLSAPALQRFLRKTTEALI